MIHGLRAPESPQPVSPDGVMAMPIYIAEYCRFVMQNEERYFLVELVESTRETPDGCGLWKQIRLCAEFASKFDFRMTAKLEQAAVTFSRV